MSFPTHSRSLTPSPTPIPHALFDTIMFDIVTRAQAVILRSLGETLAVIQQQTGLSAKQVNDLHTEAKGRGWQPGTQLRSVHVVDKPHSGRLAKVTSRVKQSVADAATKDRYGQEKTLPQLGATQFNISTQSVRRILKKHHRKHKTKPTRVPELSKDVRLARYFIAEQYRHWTLDDWKSVIWTDKTSVVLGHLRDGYRKKPSEFTFWGCFTYDFKGPCHIWHAETKAERKAATKGVELMNLAVKQECKAAWELKNTAMTKCNRRLGRKPAWKFTVDNGAFARDRGIDWYRYLTHILLPKLLPFSEALKHAGLPNVAAIEDDTPSQAPGHQRVYFDVADVQLLTSWSENSPDLNIFGDCWAYLKRITTKNGPLTSRKAAEVAWTKAWKDLEQWRIQRWIEQIPHNIEQILKLEGGNEYLERLPSTTLNRDKASWRREQRSRTRATHNDALQQFHCPTRGLPASYIGHYLSLFGIQPCAAVVEDLEEDQWNHIPATDQVVSVDPIPTLVPMLALTSGSKKKKAQKNALKDGIRKRGRQPRPQKFCVRFLPPKTPIGGI